WVEIVQAFPVWTYDVECLSGLPQTRVNHCQPAALPWPFLAENMLQVGHAMALALDRASSPLQHLAHGIPEVPGAIAAVPRIDAAVAIIQTVILGQIGRQRTPMQWLVEVAQPCLARRPLEEVAI